jgi:hypothetical protein
MLQPDGVLINVHDLPAPEMIAVHSPESTHRAGWILDRDDFDNEREAFYALAQVVADGYFNLEDERNFEYRVYVDELNELQEWLSETWTSALLTDKTIRRLEALIRDSDQPTRIVLAIQARMTKLRATWKKK